MRKGSGSAGNSPIKDPWQGKPNLHITPSVLQEDGREPPPRPVGHAKPIVISTLDLKRPERLLHAV